MLWCFTVLDSVLKIYLHFLVFQESNHFSNQKAKKKFKLLKLICLLLCLFFLFWWKHKSPFTFKGYFCKVCLRNHFLLLIQTEFCLWRFTNNLLSNLLEVKGYLDLLLKCLSFCLFVFQYLVCHKDDLLKIIITSW